MKKTVIFIVLIMLAIGTTYWFWLRPSADPKYSYTIAERIPMADDSPAGAPRGRYVVVKQEIKDWLDIVGKAVPPLSLLLAFWVKRKKN